MRSGFPFHHRLWRSFASELLERARERLERRGLARVAHQHDLRALARALDDDLDAAQRAAVRALGVGLCGGLAQRASHRRRDAIDERVMHPTAWDVDDPVRALLEDPELRRIGAAAHGQPRPMAVAQARAGKQTWRREPGLERELGQPARDAGIDAGLAPTRAAGAGRPVRAGRVRDGSGVRVRGRRRKSDRGLRRRASTSGRARRRSFVPCSSCVFGQHAAARVDLRDEPLLRVRNHELGLDHVALEEVAAMRPCSAATSLRVLGREQRRRRGTRRASAARARGVDAIDLVEHEQARHVVAPISSSTSRVTASCAREGRIGRVDDVEQQRRLERLVERRAERRDQVVRQLLDEADRVGDEDARLASRAGARARWCRASRTACRRRSTSLPVSARISDDLPALV